MSILTILEEERQGDMRLIPVQAQKAHSITAPFY